MPSPWTLRRLLLVHRLILSARRVFPRVNPDVDHRRATQAPHGFARSLQRRRDLRWIPHFLAVAAEHFRKLAERHISQEVADVAPLLAVFRKLTVADLIHGGVVTDHRKIGDSKA